MPLDAVLFRDLAIEPDVYYFLYVGEIKTDCLNQFVAETLSRSIDRKVEWISIIPDVMDCYPHGNVMVVNPESKEILRRTGEKVRCRIPARTFAASVSSSPEVLELIHSLLAAQGELFVHVFESVPELDIAGIPGVRILGPDAQISTTWNNKLHQFLHLQDAAPVIDYRICQNFEQLLQTADRLLEEWTDGMFVSQAYSAAGMNSFIAHCREDIIERLAGRDVTTFVSRYIPHDHDPTVLGVVANERDVFIACVADQQIENGNAFRGSTFPSLLPAEIKEEIRKITRSVGRVLGAAGYRGIFGCDFIVDRKGKAWFVEVNARKQGTTMEMCCTMESLLPDGAPTLMDLEYHAVTASVFPEGVQELTEAINDFCWRTYNVKIDHDMVTGSFVPQDGDERDLFLRIRARETPHGMLVVEHVGHHCRVRPGCFVGRVIAVASRREDLAAHIELGKALVSEPLPSGPGQAPQVKFNPHRPGNANNH
ncbi:MAG: ATP-grasp domain-containing protein [Desulfovibrionales bacterium]